MFFPFISSTIPLLYQQCCSSTLSAALGRILKAIADNSAYSYNMHELSAIAFRIRALIIYFISSTVPLYLSVLFLYFISSTVTTLSAGLFLYFISSTIPLLYQQYCFSTLSAILFLNFISSNTGRN
jgi:hypothetical protein